MTGPEPPFVLSWWKDVDERRAAFDDVETIDDPDVNVAFARAVADLLADVERPGTVNFAGPVKGYGALGNQLWVLFGVDQHRGTSYLHILHVEVVDEDAAADEPSAAARAEAVQRWPSRNHPLPRQPLRR